MPLVATAAPPPVTAPAGGPTLVSAPPEWVAPGVEVTLRVTADAAGTLTLERRVAGGLRHIAHTGVVPGQRVTFRYRPLQVGVHRLRMRIEGGDPRWVSLRVRPVTLAAVGDVSPGSAIAAVRAHGPTWHWERVGPWLREQDLAVGNWETATGAGGSAWPKTFTFLAPLSTLKAAADRGGLDAVSLANNHALDFGRTTFTRSLPAMRQTGPAPFGGGRNLAEATAPAVLEAGGLRIAFVGFNAITPVDFRATASRPGNAPATAAVVARSVRAARRRADLVVAFMHWGIERDPHPSAAQRRLADVALAAGADVVLGAHPHVLQPVERRGRRLIAWSLGNFVFQSGSVAGTYTGALQLRLSARGVDGWRMRRARIVATRPVFSGP